MEGDVLYIQPRPSSSTPNSPSGSVANSAGASSSSTPDTLRREQDKWDAWHTNTGLSRTAAKKAYIETLISTMHAYASATPEARELVQELEFVWDQVRNNSNPSGSDRSSPLQIHGSYPGIASAVAGGEELGSSSGQKEALRVLSPVSQAEEEERDEFVDAPAYSQYEGEEGGEEEEEEEEEGRQTGREEQARDYADSAAQDRPPLPERPLPRRVVSGDNSWRKRIEVALIKTTAEVAALREQLESRSYIAQRRRHSLLGWILRLSWFCVRLVVVDVFVLWLVILYLRRKKDRRLEGAVRVLLGDAVAQMQKVGSNMKVPKLPIRKA